jgi:NTE family protein
MPHSTDNIPRKVNQALVLSGGGARAAYQVGCLRHIAQAIPEYRPDILTGVSAGAINAVHLAAYRGDWLDAVEKLRTLWLSLETHKVYHADFRHVSRRVLHWGLRVLSGGRLGRGDVRGMVDSSPLEQFLHANLVQQDGCVVGIQENLQEAVLQAVAIITTNYASGRSEAWVQSVNEELWQKGQLNSKSAEITVPHILASAALPMFFPAVSLNGQWHGDGGIRLTAPLSPAMHLGADRILAVSPRAQSRTEAVPSTTGYPSPAQIAGVLLNSVFLDLLDFDALQMQRINDLLANMPAAEWNGFRPVDVMVLRPKEDLGELARAHEIDLPKSFRFFEQGLGDKREPSADALSMVMFEPEYLGLLMQLGEQDAAARSEEIRSFLLAKHSGEDHG